MADDVLVKMAELNTLLKTFGTPYRVREFSSAEPPTTFCLIEVNFHNGRENGKIVTVASFDTIFEMAHTFMREAVDAQK